MKQTGFVFITLLFLVSCGTPKNQFQKGNYDAAIEKAVKKLLKHPDNRDEIEILERSYKLANEQDLEDIKYLKMEGKPENWDKILRHYQALKHRQDVVRPVLPLRLDNRTIDFERVDYDKEIIVAQHNAAEYFFAHAQKLMQNGDKSSYRKAYEEFVKVKRYWGDYENIDQLIALSRYYGTSRVLVIVQNNTAIKLSPQFKESLLALDPTKLNKDWVEYYTRHLDDSVKYDYQVTVNLDHIIVSPDIETEIDTMYKKKVEDGWQYVLDNNNNVMKDSLGNDIKVKKYKTLSCTLIKTIQRKDAHIDGNVEIYSLEPLKLLKKDPITADSHWQYLSARAIGDKEILPLEEKHLLQRKKVMPPSDGDMIMRCADGLREAIRRLLLHDRHYIY
jgi:hypothetical protein